MITPSDPSEEIDPVDLKDEVEETKSSLSSESNPEIDDESPENQPSPSTSDDQKGNSKKFECDQCDFTCLTHGGLYLHQKAVHLGIRFKCDQCDYEGTQEINLKRHIESKHGTIQYCCKLCSAKTRGLWYIETHLKKIHGITVPEVTVSISLKISFLSGVFCTKPERKVKTFKVGHSN